MTDWHALARAVEPRTDAFIDGKPVPAADGRRFPTVNPATGEVLAQVAACGDEDVDRAVAAARRAFPRWAATAPGERKAVLLRLAELIRANADELALLDSLDAGKLIGDTSAVDVPGSAAILQWYAETTDKAYGEIAPTARGDLALVTREPLGVVAAVVPWNYPLEMAIWKIAPALAAGNSVVLKPAEESPLSVLRLAELAMAAGLPEGVLNVVPGLGPEAGRALGLHPDVDVVTFTGSTPVGKLFLQYAGQSNMKQVWLECGGKSANVVFADAADVDAVAAGVCFGIFTNAGQVCSANARLLVARPVRDQLLALVSEKARQIRQGDPLDLATTMGPLVSAAQADRVMRYVEIGRTEGRAVLDGGRSGHAYVSPAIFEVGPESRLSREEVFGPVLAVQAFDTEDEAVALANDSIYGLAASVWSDSLSRAHRVAGRLRAGTVSVNTVDALDVTTPFGGFGQSGFGRDLSPHALDKFTALKTTWVNYR
ncbi:aldehyde dehydrogenase [Paractinoplanes deccanensis]|uniref:Aldehyde dehydrogenase n=1 Tax=Paractinoplanes deccanensis TaxID=113561 RepID=A0ABQ3XZ83_9ACTN|nr:aldehyde dehydrogenase family protein [Actinoplanes deccanensis]GID73025.1 aldehyde dehydrogenase [Actinoplanes deccanensis]